MSRLSQTSFKGGMNTVSLDTEIPDDSYALGINVRQRYGYAEAIKKSVDITYNLVGKNQGVYALGTILLAFYSGNAYFQVLGDTLWNLIPNFSLDASVEYIYAQAVPGSTNNFLRKAVTTNAGVVDANAGIIKTNNFSVSGNPAGVVCQDGIGQPWLIEYDNINNNATARRLGTYDQWSNTSTTANDREYVPIGTLMMYLDGVLYITRGNIVMRSVSGRPLDFMINIDQDGNKLATEAQGGALSMSFAIDFDVITSILPIGSGQFTIATALRLYGMQVDFTRPIFAEPQFSKIFNLEVGTVNQFSSTDLNGDAGIIDFDGVKSYNAVKQLKTEGNNDPLSKIIHLYLEGITQTTVAAIVFNNYNYFSLTTSLGKCVAVYDNLNNVWAGFDITNATTGGIKLFAESVSSSARNLVAATSDDKIFWMYSSNERENAIVKLRSLVAGDYSAYGTFVPAGLMVEHKPIRFRAGLYCGLLSGTITAVLDVDGKRSNHQTKNIDGVVQGVLYPVFPPVYGSNSSALNNITFPTGDSKAGYKVTPTLRWDSDAKLARCELETTNISKDNSQGQQGKGMVTTAS